MITDATILTIKVIIAVVLSWFAAQVIKVMITWYKTGYLDWKVIFLPGGMPSGHSSPATALAASIYLVEGMTTLFVATSAFALLVMYDAMTLRREVSTHTKLIQSIYLKIERKKIKTILKKERIGHTPAEVFVGALIGMAVTLAVFYG